ncbi:MAG: sulfotransferase [Candidatus Marinimicrobia bacterium]|nr:sulfotransferase [Candidatus Neomarinimicrobiota bacterium]
MGRLADFLIVGAAKSGTTSLHYYLGQHPYIEMSKPKELKFLSWYAGIRGFNGPGDKKCTESRVVKSYDDYLNIFSAESKDVLCGESSTDNLYFHIEVILLIKKIIGEPKIIIILRNPVDRAFSAYTPCKRGKRE